MAKFCLGAGSRLGAKVRQFVCRNSSAFGRLHLLLAFLLCGVAASQAAPVLSSISPTSLTSGMQVTVTGSGFGASQGSGHFKLYNEYETIVSWSDTQIVAVVGSGVLAGNALVYQGAWSNSVPYTMAAPVVTSISPTSVSPGMQMTINGSGFGTTQGNYGSVPFYNNYGTVVSWSDTQIVVTVSANTLPGNVAVRQSGVASNAIAYTMIPSTVTSISPTAVSPGMQMTINGSGFGASQGPYGSVPLYNNYGTVVSWSDTQIVVTIPNDTLPGTVKVKQNGATSNGIAYTMIPSTITSISPTAVSVGIFPAQWDPKLGIHVT